MDRRKFLLLSLASGGALGIGRGFLAPAFAAPGQPGESPYGPLGEPDALGLELPEGFRSRIIKQWNQPVGRTAELGVPFPDGAATFPTDDGGWILVSNSENPPPADLTDPTPVGLDQMGGVQAVRFTADGEIADCYMILTESRSNCAGGATPWGTWLTCEEVNDGQDAANSGRVYECDPTGEQAAVDLPRLGRFKHENTTVDPVGERLYQSEDLPDGLFYRFTPDSYPDLTAGTLEAALVAEDGSVSWFEVPDPECTGGTPCRQQPAEATTFHGGEGCIYDDGKVFLTTKGDDRVWMYDTVAETMVVLYDAADFAEPVLTGVDHIIAQAGTGNLVVAEDGGNLQAVMIRREDFAVFPILKMTGAQHFVSPQELIDMGITIPQELLTQIPTESEVSGLAFNPAGDRLYFNSQRAHGGTTYEVQGPWLEALQGEQPAPTTTLAPTTTAAPTTAPPATVGGERLPATGGSDLSPLAIGAGAGAAALVALRRRLDRQLPEHEDARP